MTTLDERPAGGPQDSPAGRGRTPGAGPTTAAARPAAAPGGASADPERQTDPRLRVVLLLDVLEGRQDQFLQAYELIRHQVAAVPGHISDQLCQSLGNSSQWLITSEWESSEPFLEWVESAAHRAMVEPLHGCVRDTTSLRFVVARETPDPTAAGARPARPAVPAAGPRQSLDPLPAPPLCSGGVVRHAITFTVRQGAEDKVAKLLADYTSPSARVDDTTRLLRTSLYMDGNRVVRAVEVSGDLGNALRHVAAQPGVRAVEEAINPYLEEDRDLTDAASARAFFARAALPAVEHAAAGGAAPRPGEVVRVAYVHPVEPAQGPAEARRLAALDAADCAQDAHPLAAATCFQRGDVLVRVLDVRAAASGAAGAATAPGAKDASGARNAAGADPAVPAELARGGRPMDLITDRTAQDA